MNGSHLKCDEAEDAIAPEVPDEKPARIIGVDGEGEDTPDGGHIYTYLAAVDELGVCVSEAWNPKGLTHDECAAMILRIPAEAMCFAFMFSYDVTKILEEMPHALVYQLLRPETRESCKCRVCGHSWKGVQGNSACPAIHEEGRVCGAFEIQSFPVPVYWRKRAYDFFNGSFTITGRGEPTIAHNPSRPWDRPQGKRKTVKIWDCFRFFGCAFVEAIRDWKVGSEAQIETIAEMKAKRGEFADESPDDVRRYCRLECQLLAQMMRKVLDSHEKAEIPLTSFYGAGSTAGALLKKNEVGHYKGPRTEDLDPSLAAAIKTAFFGGRFENSTIGTVKKPVHSYDISSAYPYTLSALPCLACGKWTRIVRPTKRQIKGASLALIKTRVGDVTPAQLRSLAWCPLPFRDSHGSIAYGTNFTGWAWRSEYESACSGWAEIVEDRPAEAWLYDTTCNHRPFAFLPDVYRRRCEWGKEGPGKVLKLGSNASYGKTAQSIGADPPFRSMVWAGMTTSETRAQLNRGICAAADRWNVLALATDGIYATAELDLELPRDTGTSDLEKPLGGWEHKVITEGAFLAKPGLYFRLRALQAETTKKEDKENLAEIRARGIGRREVYQQRNAIVEAFAAWDRKDFDYHLTMTSRRFFGAKHTIAARSGCVRCGTGWAGLPEQGCPTCGEHGDRFSTNSQKLPDGREAYGSWSVRQTKVGFDPRPKRDRVTLGGSYGRLRTRDLGGQISTAYQSDHPSPEGAQAASSTDFALDQPDWEEKIA